MAASIHRLVDPKTKKPVVEKGRSKFIVECPCGFHTENARSMKQARAQKNGHKCSG